MHGTIRPEHAELGTVLFGLGVLLAAAEVFAPSLQAQSAPSPKLLSAFEQLALLAFNPSAKPLSSITLNGTATWTAGSLQESGTVALKASADGSMAETWTLPTQSHTHTATAWSEGRTCSLTDNQGAVHAAADPN